jgi:hypothetical protein
VPLRLFLSGLDLTPTYRSVNNRFSVKYYLNLVLVDEEDRRYFKQSVSFFFFFLFWGGGSLSLSVVVVVGFVSCCRLYSSVSVPALCWWTRRTAGTPSRA